MPFLPSEGEETKLLINEQMKNVLVFHYLPILWYRHPIPNDIREFWYTERPDILEYMEKAYQDLDIQFLPDDIVSQLKHLENNLNPMVSTELLSKNDLIPRDLFFTKLHSLTDYFTTFFVP